MISERAHKNRKHSLELTVVSGDFFVGISNAENLTKFLMIFFYRIQTQFSKHFDILRATVSSIIYNRNET